MHRIQYLIILLLFLPFAVLAEELPYTDVQPGIWYGAEVQSFVDAKYLDAGQKQFRAGDKALRAEFMKLVVGLNGSILDELPGQPSFVDVPPHAWFFGYLEESAREGWTKGDNNCYGSANCFARPGSPITRAEAAVLIRRAFGKTRTGKAPAFSDNLPGEWYTDSVQGAADHCILRGDDGTRNVRPHDLLNRAEMIVMLYRVDNSGMYPDC